MVLKNNRGGLRDATSLTSTPSEESPYRVVQPVELARLGVGSLHLGPLPVVPNSPDLAQYDFPMHPALISKAPTQAGLTMTG